MNKILVDIREENNTIKKHFNNKDVVSVEELLDIIDNLSYELDRLDEEYKDFKQSVKENYRQIPVSEQVQVYDKDFH